MGDYGGQLVLQGAELELVIPTAGARVVWLGRDQVASGDQFMAWMGA